MIACTCKPDPAKPEKLTIKAAADAGHMVIAEGQYDHSTDRKSDKVLFAGTLAQSLDYVKGKMGEPTT